jgi:hypothetical protein
MSESKRDVLVAVLCTLAVLLTMWVVLARPAGAQMLPEHEWAYLADHPIDPDQMILATTDGRYAFQRQQDCQLRPGTNVVLDRAAMLFGTFPYVCGYAEPIFYVDPTPCFQNAEGACDVALEQEE